MPSWHTSNQRGFCDSRKSVKTRQRPLSRLPTGCRGSIEIALAFKLGCQSRHRASMGGNLNDKTISRERRFPCHQDRGLSECNSVWAERSHCSHTEFGFAWSCWHHLSIMTECVITKCRPLNPRYNWQHGAVTKDGEQNGKPTKRRSLSDT